MLRSLHTVSSGARHAIQPHLLSIQFLFLRSFVYKTAAKPNPKKKRSVIYPSLHGVLERSQCHAAAAEGAKLSKIRRGNGFSLAGTACRISSDSCAVVVIIYMS